MTSPPPPLGRPAESNDGDGRNPVAWKMPADGTPSSCPPRRTNVACRCHVSVSRSSPRRVSQLPSPKWKTCGGTRCRFQEMVGTRRVYDPTDQVANSTRFTAATPRAPTGLGRVIRPTASRTCTQTCRLDAVHAMATCVWVCCHVCPSTVSVVYIHVCAPALHMARPCDDDACSSDSPSAFPAGHCGATVYCMPTRRLSGPLSAGIVPAGVSNFTGKSRVRLRAHTLWTTHYKGPQALLVCPCACAREHFARAATSLDSVRAFYLAPLFAC